MRRQAGLAALALALLLGACTAGPQQNAESPESTSGAAPAPSELPDSALLQPPGTEEYTARSQSAWLRQDSEPPCHPTPSRMTRYRRSSAVSSMLPQRPAP